MEAIIKVLEDSDVPLHYTEIAEQIVEDHLRSSVGATPASTVVAYISSSIKENGSNSPFVRVNRGEYSLRSKFEGPFKELGSEMGTEEELSAATETGPIVQAFGMYWQREAVLWGATPNLYGRQQIGADLVNIAGQTGVYLLHDGRNVIYVGRSIDRPLGKRLYEHTQDRLAGRWDRFSWFGMKSVRDDGTLKDVEIKPSIESIIATLEALLIESLEPPQNRKRGDEFSAIEYIQAKDPESEKVKKKKLLGEIAKQLDL